MVIRQPKWRIKPEEVEILYTKITWGPFRLEAEVELKVNGHYETVNVPKNLVNESSKTVKGAVTADVDDGYVLVAFQPTSLGAFAIRIKKSLLKYPIRK